jgi:tetratricopeptide (TPR) repeat protein
MIIKRFFLIIFGIFLSLFFLEISLQVGSFIVKKKTGNIPSLPLTHARILCVGDSYTYGLGVDKEDSYPAQLEKIIKKESGKDDIEVINCGVPGYNTPLLEKNFAKILDVNKPEIVLIMIGANDHWNFAGFEEPADDLFSKIADMFNHLKIFRMFRIFPANFKKNNPVYLFSAGSNNTVRTIDMYRANSDLSDFYYLQAVFLGNKYRDSKKLDQAKKYYDYAQSVNPDDYLITKELVGYYIVKMSVEHQGLGSSQIRTILSFFARFYRLSEPYLAELILLANEYRDQNKMEKAELIYDFTLKVKPYDNQVVREILRYYKFALENPGLKIRDDTDNYKIMIIKIEKLLSRYICSVLSVRDGVTAEFSLLETVLEIVKICRESNYYEDSLELLAKSIVLYGLNQLIWEELDELFIAWNDPEKAIKFYNIINNKYKNNPDVLIRLARQYKILRDYAQVKKYLQNFIEVEPRNKDAHQGIEQADLFLKQNMASQHSFGESDEQFFKMISEIINGQYFKTVGSESETALKNTIELEEEDIEIKQKQEKIKEIAYDKLTGICRQARARNIITFVLNYPMDAMPRTKQAALTLKTGFIDINQGFMPYVSLDNIKDLFQPDGHCTVKGNKIMAETVAKEIIEFLP